VADSFVVAGWNKRDLVDADEYDAGRAVLMQPCLHSQEPLRVLPGLRGRNLLSQHCLGRSNPGRCPLVPRDALCNHANTLPAAPVATPSEAWPPPEDDRPGPQIAGSDLLPGTPGSVIMRSLVRSHGRHAVRRGIAGSAWINSSSGEPFPISLWTSAASCPHR
jgi:hypothetical protein